jgi:phage-related protein
VVTVGVGFKSATSGAAYTPVDEIVTAAKPGGLAENDVIVAVMFATGGPMTPPDADWHQAGSDGLTPGVSIGKVWTKVAGPDEPSSYDWGMSNSDSAVLFLSAHTDVRTSAPVGDLTWGGATTPASAQVAPAQAPAALGSMIVAAWGATGGGGSYLPPAEMSECGDTTTAWQFGATAYEARPSTGDTGSRTATCSASTGYLSVSLVLMPAGGEDVAETTVWIDATGGMTQLDVDWDVSGRFAPPNQFDADEVPDQPGARLRAVRHKARELVVPVWMDAESETALRTAVRRLVAVMDPIRGEGKIRVTGPGGDQRELNCRYRAGLELAERLGMTSAPLMQRAPLVFWAADPYWYPVSDEVAEYTIGAATTSWFPFPPLRLGTSELFTDATVVNVGDVEAWPVWQITGPGSAIVLRNATTGALLELSTTLVGETVTIDTRPGAKSVLLSDGTNLFGSLSDSSSLWNFARGANQIRVEMAGATTDSRLRLSWKPRYLTA